MNLDDPFTLILTVPRALVAHDADATSAVDPVLSARFGWDHYDVVDPATHRDLYEDAAQRVEAQAGPVQMLDLDRGLLHVGPKLGSGQEADLYVRVVRLFPQGFPIGVYSPVVGEA